MNYAIEGMHCASCASRIESALAKIPGAESVNVNYATRQARVGGSVPDEAVFAAVLSLGYQASPIIAGTVSGSAVASKSRAKTELIAASALSVPVFVLGMLHHDFPGNGLLQLILTTAVLAWPGRGFFTRSIRMLRFGSANMDTLVALGAGAAYAASVFALSRGVFLYYFESAAVIVTLVLLGQYLEENARRGSAEAIRKLRALQPQTARVRSFDGKERDVPIDQLRPGDAFVVRPGERIAVDGVIAEGSSLLDESLVTGESLPVARHPREDVIGTTINVGTGVLLVRCSAEPGKTVLSQIVSLVEDAQSSKAAVQRLADRVAQWFVPAVLVVAVVTALVWYFGQKVELSTAILHAVAVLVIACPCAMGLATPTAILAGTGRAAQELILIRSAPGLERAERLSVAVVDKTGTLTEGRPAVTAVFVEPGFFESDVLALIGAAESGSGHPLAKALASYADAASGVPLALRLSFEETAGQGVRAQVRLADAIRAVLVGSSAYLAKNGVAIPPAWDKAAELSAGQLFAAVNGVAAARIVVEDPIRSTTAAAIAALRRMGLDIVMATGDRRATAAEVAQKLGITTVHAELLPAQKVALIKALQASGERVCMVGDGLNDAPALTQADVGIAIGGGADIAEDAADLVIPHGNLAKIADAIYISRSTMRVIRQNLVWAFAYNVLAIPIAAAGQLSPMIAAGAMAFSSLSVVGNSLRLRRLKGAVAT